MSQIQSATEAAPAALVGSLSTFKLIDVLDMLARTGHSGELQVVGKGVDRRVWIDAGDLVDNDDSRGTPLETAVFELACIEDGWFYFTSARAPEGSSRVSIVSLLDSLGPQVQEWRALVEVLPFEATVCMSSSTPAGEVQIRGDQWQMLSLVGNPGRPVREVIDATNSHPLDAMRTLRELSDAGLVLVVMPDPEVLRALQKEAESVASDVPLAPIGSPSTGQQPPSPPLKDANPTLTENAEPLSSVTLPPFTTTAGPSPTPPIDETNSTPSPDSPAPEAPSIPDPAPAPSPPPPPPPPPPPVIPIQPDPPSSVVRPTPSTVASADPPGGQWTPEAASTATKEGDETGGPKSTGGSSLPPFVPNPEVSAEPSVTTESTTPAPVPPAPPGWVESNNSDSSSDASKPASGSKESKTDANEAGSDTDSQNAKDKPLPPPISGDPWSSSVAEPHHSDQDT